MSFSYNCQYKAMINKNLDYFLTKYKKQQKEHKSSPYSHGHIDKLASIFTNIYSKLFVDKNQRFAFNKILYHRKPVIAKWSHFQSYFRNRLQQAFFQIKRTSVLRSKIYLKSISKKNSFLAYLITKTIACKARYFKESFLMKLKEESLKVLKLKQVVNILSEVLYKYQERMFYEPFLMKIKAHYQKSITMKKDQTILFWKVMQKVIINKYRITLSKIFNSTAYLRYVSLEKEKHLKKLTVQKQFQQKSQILTECKRKITFKTGQINQFKIQNKKYKSDGEKEIGLFLTKKNAQIRAKQIDKSKLQEQIIQLQLIFKFKEERLLSKNENTISIQFYMNIYNQIAGMKSLPKKSIQNIINKNSKMEYKQFCSNLGELIYFQNVKMNALLNYYENPSPSQKQKSSEHSIRSNTTYDNIENENTHLKELIASLIKMKNQAAIEKSKQNFTKHVNTIQENLIQFKNAMKKMNVNVKIQRVGSASSLQSMPIFSQIK